jgi:EmrB/QacA subfamily drug resistance transporter
MTATGGSGSQDALGSPPLVPPATADQASSKAKRQRQLSQIRTAEHFTLHTASSATITDSNGNSALSLRTVSTAAARSEVRLRSPMGRAIVAAAVLGSALAYMSDDMLNVAIPSVAADLGGTVGDIQWVVNTYYVTLVALVLVAGAVGDIVGHRRVFVAGMALFTVGALACAVAPSVWVLIVGRGVQGIGAAMTLAAGLALVSQLIHPDERGRAIGVFMGLVAALPAVGPALSGALVDMLSWRAIFLAPLLFPVCAFLLTRVRIPETPRVSGRRPDLPGAAAALVALAALTIALIEGPSGWSRILPVAAVAVAVLATVLFVMVERRVEAPMLPLRLLHRRVFVGGNLVTLLAYMTSSGAFFFVAVSVQTTLGYRPLLAGVALMPLYIVMTLGAPLSGRLADRTGPRIPTLAGLAVYTAGVWMLSGIGPGSGLLADVLPGLVVTACGAATFGPPLATATLGALDDADQGVASGVNNAVGQLAGLLAIAVLPAVAGLTDAPVGGAVFASGYSQALRIAAGIAVAATVLAAATFRGCRPAVSNEPGALSVPRIPARHPQ